MQFAGGTRLWRNKELVFSELLITGHYSTRLKCNEKRKVKFHSSQILKWSDVMMMLIFGL